MSNDLGNTQSMFALGQYSQERHSGWYSQEGIVDQKMSGHSTVREELPMDFFLVGAVTHLLCRDSLRANRCNSIRLNHAFTSTLTTFGKKTTSNWLRDSTPTAYVSYL